MADHISPENFYFVENGSEIEVPDSYLPERTSRAMHQYDLPELYEGYARRSRIPDFTITIGPKDSWDVRDFVDKYSPMLIGMYSSYPDSRTDGTSYLLDNTIGLFHDLVFPGNNYTRFLNRIHFVDPEESLGDLENWHPTDSCGFGMVQVTTTSRTEFYSRDTTYAHTASCSGSFTRGEVPSSMPFRVFRETKVDTGTRTVSVDTHDGDGSVNMTLPANCLVWTSPEKLAQIRGYRTVGLYNPGDGDYVEDNSAPSYLSPVSVYMNGIIPLWSRTIDAGSEGIVDEYVVTQPPDDLGTNPTPDTSHWPFYGRQSYFSEQAWEQELATGCLLNGEPRFQSELEFYSPLKLEWNYWKDNGLNCLDGFDDTDDVRDAKRFSVSPFVPGLLPHFRPEGKDRFPPDRGELETYHRTYDSSPSDRLDVRPIADSWTGTYDSSHKIAWPYKEVLDGLAKWREDLLTRTVYPVTRYMCSIEESFSLNCRHHSESHSEWTSHSEGQGDDSGSEDSWSDYITEVTNGTRSGTLVCSLTGGSGVRLYQGNDVQGLRYHNMGSLVPSMTELDVGTEVRKYHYASSSDGSGSSSKSSSTNDSVNRIEDTTTFSHSVKISGFKPCSDDQRTGGIDDVATWHEKTTYDSSSSSSPYVREYDRKSESKSIRLEDVKFLIPKQRLKFVKSAHLYALVHCDAEVWLDLFHTDASGSVTGWGHGEYYTVHENRSDGQLSMRRYKMVDLGTMGEDGTFSGSFDPYDVAVDLTGASIELPSGTVDHYDIVGKVTSGDVVSTDYAPGIGGMGWMDASESEVSEYHNEEWTNTYSTEEGKEGRPWSAGYPTNSSYTVPSISTTHGFSIYVDSMFLVIDWQFDKDLPVEDETAETPEGS